jgi:hypothetical protein
MVAAALTTKNYFIPLRTKELDENATTRLKPPPSNRKERKGKERKGEEMRGKERRIKESRGKERKGE